MRIKATIESSREEGTEDTSKRVIPPQLTPQRLAEFMGAQRLCWVIEDFHKMALQEKTPLSQALKIFSDASAEYPEVKVVAVGATETAREVVEYDHEMRNRVAEIGVPLMTKDELRAVLENGQKLMNVDFRVIGNEIVEFSMGVASITHQLALSACLDGGIVVTQASQHTFPATVLPTIIEQYVDESSDTLKATFDRALKRHRVRTYDNTRLILRALARGPLEGMLHAEILGEIHKEAPSYPASNLTVYLRELLGDERGNILRLGEDGKYRYADPLHHTFAQLSLVHDPQALAVEAERRDELWQLVALRLYRSERQLSLFEDDDDEDWSEIMHRIDRSLKVQLGRRRLRGRMWRHE